MKKDILFGICADVHHSGHSDESWRVKKFVSEATERGADAVEHVAVIAPHFVLVIIIDYLIMDAGALCQFVARYHRIVHHAV